MEDGAVVVLQRAARRMNAQNQLRSSASQAKAEKSGIACGAGGAEPCSCCQPTVTIRKGMAYDHNTTLPAWRSAKKEDTKDELTPYVLSIGDEKSGGSAGFNGRKFPSWSAAIMLFIDRVIPQVERKFGYDQFLGAPKPSPDDGVAGVLDGMIHIIECQQAKEKLSESVRRFFHQQFHMEFLWGTCITRRGGHFISPNETSLRYLLDKALEFAKTNKIDPKTQKPYVYLEEIPLFPINAQPTFEQYRNRASVPHTVNVWVKCMKDHDIKPCPKYITLAGMAENLLRFASLLREVEFPELLNQMNPFGDVIQDCTRFADIIQSKMLEIANALDPRVVACCPGNRCNYTQRSKIAARVPDRSIRWVRTKIHDCERCGLRFCCDCGAEIAGDENHVCNMMHHFEALPKETKDKIKAELGRNYQFCPECKTVAEHGKAGEDRGCDKLTCTECRTCFCVRCGERVDPATYFGEHMTHLNGCGRILCRFSVVYEGATIPSKPYNSMFGFRSHGEILREVLSMIGIGNRQVLTDFGRIAREREMYPNAIHPEVKAALRRVHDLHLFITPEEQTVLFRE